MAKQETKNKAVSKMYEKYKDGKLQAKTCPKCGKGNVLAKHKDRMTCGRCGYTEFN